MKKDILIVVFLALVAIVTIVIINASVVSYLALLQSATLGTGSPTPATTSATIGIWSEYIKPSIGSIGAILAALIAGGFAYFHLLRQLKTASRNAFLDMLIDNSTYRNQLDSYLNALIQENFDDLDKRINENTALFYLFILKPNLRESLKDAIADKDITRVMNLTEQLFTA